MTEIGISFEAVIVEPMERFPVVGEVIKCKILDETGRFRVWNAIPQRNPRFMVSGEFTANLFDRIREMQPRSKLRPPLDTTIWEKHFKTLAGTRWHYWRPNAKS